MVSPICEVAIRHGEGTYLVTFSDGESFAMCPDCADDALVATENVKVERLTASRRQERAPRDRS